MFVLFGTCRPLHSDPQIFDGSSGQPAANLTRRSSLPARQMNAALTCCFLHFYEKILPFPFASNCSFIPSRGSLLFLSLSCLLVQGGVFKVDKPWQFQSLALAPSCRAIRVKLASVQYQRRSRASAGSCLRIISTWPVRGELDTVNDLPFARTRGWACRRAGYCCFMRWGRATPLGRSPLRKALLAHRRGSKRMAMRGSGPSSPPKH